MPDHTPTTPPPLTPTRATARRATSAVAHLAPEPEAGDPLLGFAPYLHVAPRRNSITPEVQRRFVAALAATGLVSAAARTVGRSLEALYKLRHRPGAEGFAAAWDEALTRGARRLEDMAFERALVGTRTPIVSGGQLVDWWDKPDNALLRFLLRHRLPQTYGAQPSEAEAHRRFVQQLGPGHPVYESIRADVLAAEAARAQAHAAALRARRAEIGALEGFDPDEMEDGEPEEREEPEDIMALDDDAFLAAWERQRAETRRRYREEYGGGE